MKQNKNPEMTHGNIVNQFLIVVKTQFQGERIVFSANDAGTTRYPYTHMHTDEPRHIPYIFPNNNAKSIINLNVKFKTVHFLGKKVGEIFI